MLLTSRKWVWGWDWTVYRSMVPGRDSSDRKDPCFQMSNLGHPLCVLFLAREMDGQRARPFEREAEAVTTYCLNWSH